MTPLAHFMAKQLTRPVRDRRVHDQCNLLGNMDDIHCFECTDIIPAVREVLDNARAGSCDRFVSTTKQMIGEMGFLPASKTWIEWREDEGRIAFLLTDGGANYSATVFHAFGVKGDNVAGTARGYMKLPLMLGVGGDITLGLEEFDDAAQLDYLFHLLVLLAFINTPRIVGRRQHMPHRGLERDLLRARPMVGKFPLHAWTEIKLEITPPCDVSDDPSIEAHYTGARALHFCRSYCRVRLGRLEVIRGHWKGDPSIGIRRSRYRVVPPAQPEAH